MIWKGQLFQQPFAYGNAEMIPETVRENRREIRYILTLVGPSTAIAMLLPSTGLSWGFEGGVVVFFGGEDFGLS